MKRLATLVLLSLVALAVLAFYAWTASNGTTFGFDEPQYGAYNLMTRALLSGSTSIEATPDPRLFEIANPYDPRANTNFRFHDASLFRGRYYLYWGLAPVVALFAPCRLVGLGDLPHAAGALAFGAGAFLFGLLILERLVRCHLPDAPLWLRAASVLVLGIANVVPFLLRGVEVYEVAIAAGACFLLGSAFFALTAAETESGHLGRLALSGLFAGLAFASRPNHLFAVPFLLALGMIGLRTTKGRRLAALAAWLAPLAAVGLGVAAFNYARFGSFTEFGTRYQLAGTHPLFFRFFDLGALGPGLYFYLFAPPSLSLDFPHVVLQRGFSGELPAGYLPADLVAGILFHAPVVLALLAALPILTRVGDRLFRLRVLTLAGLGFSQLVLTSIAVPAAVQRYEADFMSPLLIASLALWLAASGLGAGLTRAATVLGFLTLAAWTLVANAAFSLRGFHDPLPEANPALWSRLEKTFGAVRPLVGRFVRDARATVRMRIAFAQRPADDLEPLLASGTSEVQDVLFARRAASDHYCFVLRLADGSEVSSGVVNVRPGQLQRLRVELDRIAGLVVVTLDDREVARLAARLQPLEPTRLLPGRGARGKAAADLGRFSGAFVTEDMERAADDGLGTLPSLLDRPALLVSAKESLPATAEAGQLAAVAGSEGARLFDGTRWRWLPLGALDRLRVERALPQGSAPSPPETPLLISAAPEGTKDELLLRSLPGGRAQVVFRTAGGASITGEPFPWIASAPGTLEIELDRVSSHVEVKLAGRTLLRSAAALLPLRPHQLALP